MRRKPYQAYEDSTIEWLGQRPSHWALTPVKRVFWILNGSTPKSGEPAYWDGEVAWATPDDLGALSGDTLHRTQRMITIEGYNSCGTSLAPMGSLVLSTRAPIGHLAIAGIPLCTNQGCHCLVFRRKNDARYFYYQILAAKQELESWGQGSTFKELSRDKLGNILVILPPIREQSTIAAFLDRETERINTLIAKKERQIELLQEKRTALISHAVTKGLDPNVPMKDSGVEWLGEIPAHWEVKELKYFSNIVLGKMLESVDSGNHNKRPYLRAQNIVWEKVDDSDIREMWFSEKELVQYRLKVDDLLVSEGGEVGRTAIWKNELDECYIQNSVHKVTIQRNYIPYYFLYHFLAHGKAGYFESIVNRVSIAHLTREKLKEVLLLIPPIQEQRAVAEFLHCETARIDSLISKISEAIGKLLEYRTALISAAVTGKIDVCGES